MPRLINKTYLKQRAHLRRLWFEAEGGALSRLTASEQWDLHGFFAFVDSFSDEQALAYRTRTTEQQPSLPQQAGRAYAHLQTIEQRLAKLPPRPVFAKGGKRTNIRARDRHIVAHGLVRPHVDYEKLTRALLEHAQLEEAKRREEGQ